MCRRRHQRDVLGKTLVLVVQHGIETLFCEGEDSAFDPMFEFALDGWFLFLKGISEGIIRCCFPSVQTINLWSRFVGVRYEMNVWAKEIVRSGMN
jgi:hypothetical protein